MKIALSDLATLVGGTLMNGDPDQEITGFASLKEAVAGDLSFFHDTRYNERLLKTNASAVLVPADYAELPPQAAYIAVADPSRSFELIVETYGFQPAPFVAGVHASAVIASTVKFDPARVAIGPYAVIEDGVELADGVEIGAGCFVGRNAQIGKNSKLFANSTVHAECSLGSDVILHSGVVIGADGFGYEFSQGRHRKVRQAGIVQIDNDVEIGAGSMVDRARFGRTWISEGTKIDNLVNRPQRRDRQTLHHRGMHRDRRQRGDRRLRCHRRPGRHRGTCDCGIAEHAGRPLRCHEGFARWRQILGLPGCSSGGREAPHGRSEPSAAACCPREGSGEQGQRF